MFEDIITLELMQQQHQQQHQQQQPGEDDDPTRAPEYTPNFESIFSGATYTCNTPYCRVDTPNTPTPIQPSPPPIQARQQIQTSNQMLNQLLINPPYNVSPQPQPQPHQQLPQQVPQQLTQQVPQQLTQQVPQQGPQQLAHHQQHQQQQQQLPQLLLHQQQPQQQFQQQHQQHFQQQMPLQQQQQIPLQSQQQVPLQQQQQMPIQQQIPLQQQPQQQHQQQQQQYTQQQYTQQHYSSNYVNSVMQQHNYVSRNNCHTTIESGFANLVQNQNSNYAPASQTNQSYPQMTQNLYNCPNNYVPPPVIGAARPAIRQPRNRTAFIQVADIRTSRASVVRQSIRAPPQTLNPRAPTIPTIPVRAAALVPVPVARSTLPSPTPQTAITATTNTIPASASAPALSPVSALPTATATATTQSVSPNLIRATSLATPQAPGATNIQANRTVANINAIIAAKTTPTTPVSAQIPTQQPASGTTPASVTSTTRPPSAASLQNIEIAPLTVNKACQVKMDQVQMVTKCMNTSIATADAECQTDVFEAKRAEVKTYVDRASSPIPVTMFAKQKQTPKRRRVSTPEVDEDKSDDEEEEEEVDVME